MEIPDWLKGLTPKKIDPDSPAVPAETAAQPASADTIPASDTTMVMGAEETVADNSRTLNAPLPDMEAPGIDDLNAPAGKLPDWLKNSVGAPAVPASGAPAFDEHFFGQTAEEIEAEKAQKRAEFAAQAAQMPDARDQVIEGSFVAAPATDAAESTAELPATSVLSQEADSLKARAREDFQKRGIRLIEIFSENEIPRNAHFWYWTRVQKERFKNLNTYNRVKNRFILNPDLIDKYAGKKTIFMHPLPRVLEIAEEVDKDPRAMYFRHQLKNGMYVRMALLGLVLGRLK